MFGKSTQKERRQELEDSRVQGASLVTYMQPSSMVSEQLRNIRTNIKFAQVDSKARGKEEVQSIMVTSPGIGDGKSTISANLAYLFTSNDQDVLLVDTDTDNPDMYKAHVSLDLPNLRCRMNSLDDADGSARYRAGIF